MAEGLDYSFSRPNISQMAAGGCKFVVRYLYHGSKGIDRAELASLHAAGIDVALVYEAGATAPLGGSLAGASTAQTAVSLAREIGAPAGTAIYFTVDFDAQPGQYYAIGEFFTGIKAHVAPYAAGVYGHADIVETIQARGIKYGWTTYAWSGGAVAPNSHLYQYQNGVNIYGATVDRDRSLQDEFGAWKAHPDTTPPPVTKDPEENELTKDDLASIEHLIEAHNASLENKLRADFKAALDAERESYAKRITAYMRAYGLVNLINHSVAQGAKLDSANAALKAVEADVATVKAHLGVK